MHLLSLAVLLAATSAAGNQPGEPLAVLVPGTGEYSHPVSNMAPQAQPFFDQGLRLHYGFYAPLAIASFREAARLDPDCAMAYWGQALAIAPSPNSRYFDDPDDRTGAGLAAARKALELSGDSSERERAMIRALADYYENPSHLTRAENDRAYSLALRELHERYGDDVDIATIYAASLMVQSPWHYWTKDGWPRSGTLEAKGSLEGAMTRSPRHPGAHHYYVHLLEGSTTPGVALESAEILGETMPNVGHTVHMPSHIYLRIGMYDMAIVSNKLSVDADRRFLEAWGDTEVPFGLADDMSAQNHSGHAYGFSSYAAVLGGNYREAIAAARSSTAHVSGPPFSGSAQRTISRNYFILARFRKWDEIRAEPAPHPSARYATGIWHFVNGLASCGKGDTAAARSSLDEVGKIAAEPEVADLTVTINGARKMLRLAEATLAGEIARTEGRFDEALTSLEKATRLEDSLKYMEPADWFLSAREFLGTVLLMASKPDEAESVFWEDLRRYPENVWSLYGVWKSLVAQGKNDEAEQVKQRLVRAMVGSDVEFDLGSG